MLFQQLRAKQLQFSSVGNNLSKHWSSWTVWSLTILLIPDVVLIWERCAWKMLNVSKLSEGHNLFFTQALEVSSTSLQSLELKVSQPHHLQQKEVPMELF